MATEHIDLKSALSHVLWIGGSPCSGKTSIAKSLAARNGVSVYHFDRHEPFHIHRSIPERQPAVIAFMSMTMDRRWLLRTPEEMAQGTIRSWTERFNMVVDDLLAMPRDATIIAEGPGLFPECVYPLLEDGNRGVWLVPTRQFLTHVRESRERTSADATSDPPRALRNIIERDMLLAAHVRSTTAELGLAVLEIDRAEAIEQAQRVIDERSCWVFARATERTAVPVTMARAGERTGGL